jgi:hypothetical protein
VQASGSGEIEYEIAVRWFGHDEWSQSLEHPDEGLRMLERLCAFPELRPCSHHRQRQCWKIEQKIGRSAAFHILFSSARPNRPA